MKDILEQAIELRKQGAFEASRALLMPLLSTPATKGRAHLHMAWSFDNQGKEAQAIEHYLKALDGHLTETEIFDGLFGLASTYRSLGFYEKAIVVFENIINQYPDAIEAKPFYAMCLYNIGRYKEATALLLNLLLETTDEAAILEYKRAIALYAEDLDRSW